MNKRYLRVIVWVLAVFILIVFNPWTYSQTNTPPASSSKTIYVGNNKDKVDTKIEAKKAKDTQKISNKLTEIADNLSIYLDENISFIEKSQDTPKSEKDKIIIFEQEGKCQAVLDLGNEQDEQIEIILNQRNCEQIRKIFIQSIKDYRYKKYGKSWNVSVFLDGKPIFIVPPGEIDQYPREKRARIITGRIQKIAEDPSISLDSIQVSTQWDGMTNIVAGDVVLFTITDKDATAAKVKTKNRKKLADEYLQKIKEAISTYRGNRRINTILSPKPISFSWIKDTISELQKSVVSALKDIVAIILDLIIIITVLAIICSAIHLIFPNLFRPAWNIIKEWFRLGIELILYISLISLTLRLIILVFNANFEAFLPRNLTAVELGRFITHLGEVARIIGFMSLLGTVVLLIHWLSSEREGIVVLPFEDATDKQKFAENIGKAIADSLIQELERIRQIHKLLKYEDEKDINLPSSLARKIDIGKLPYVQDNPEEKLAGIGTVELEKTTFQLGPILLALRHWWPFGGVNTVIRGSIQTYPSNVCIVRLVARLNQIREITTWEVTRPYQNNIGVKTQKSDLITEMIRELAFKIVHSLLTPDNISSKTWESFRYYTEAIACYHQYKQSNNNEYLDEAFNNCVTAKSFEITNISVAELFYRIGWAYLENKNYDKAQNCFELYIEIEPKISKIAYFHYGLGNVYYSKKQFAYAIDQYERAIRLNKGLTNCWSSLLYYCIHLFKRIINLIILIAFFVVGFLIPLSLYIILEFILNLTSKQCLKLKDLDLIQELQWRLLLCQLYCQSIFENKYDIIIVQKVIIIKKIVEFIAKNTDKYLPQNSRFYNGIGNVYFEQQKYGDALSKYQEAIESNPKLWTAHHNLANLYTYIDEYRDYDKAIIEFSESIKCNNQVAHPHSGLGLACFFKALYSVNSSYKNLLLDKAIEELEKALCLDSKEPYLYWNLGLVKLGQLVIEDKHKSDDEVIDEVIFAWNRALEIIKERKNKEDEMCRAIYEYVLTVFQQKQNLLDKPIYREIDKLLKSINKFAKRKSHINIIKFDLKTILIILGYKEEDEFEKYQDECHVIERLTNIL
jgi:tetratricopeptide (TPR) repeat protein